MISELCIKYSGFSVQTCFNNFTDIVYFAYGIHFNTELHLDTSKSLGFDHRFKMTHGFALLTIIHLFIEHSAGPFLNT